MDFSGLITKMVIFVVLMVIGWCCARSGMISGEFTRTTSKLVINFFMCGTILNSVIATELKLEGGALVTAFLVMTVSILCCYGVAAVVARLVPMDNDKRPLFELLSGVVNSMFIGLPVVDALFGPLAVFYCSLSNISYNIILYTYGVWRLKNGDSGINLREILSTPLITTMVAVLIFLLRIPMPGFVKELVSSIAGATMPLSMIVIGASLGSVSLVLAFRQWRYYVLSFCRLVLTPALAWFLCRMLTNDPALLTTAAIVAGCPSGVVVSVLTLKYDKDAVFTSQGILHSTTLAMFTIPAMVWLIA